MNNIKDLNTEDIEFIKIDKYVEARDVCYLEYTVWMKTTDLGIVGYKVVEEINSAFEHLSYYSKQGVLSDYYLDELQDTEVLSAIKCARTSIDAVIKEGINIRKIELRPVKTSIYTTLYEINKARGRIKSIDANSLSPITMLNFNESNFDISHRYYNKESGFKTYFLTNDDKVRDFEVETIGQVNIINRMEKDLGNGRFQYIVSGEDIDHRAYDFYFDGKLFDRRFINLFLDVEVLINQASNAFRTLISKKTCDALYRVVAGIEPIKFTSSGYSGRAATEKKCTVKHCTRILSTTRLAEIFREFNLQEDYDGQLDNVIKYLKTNYHEQTYTDIVRTLINYKGMTRTNMVIQTKIDSISIGHEYIGKMLRVVCLKQLISSNEMSEKIYGFEKQMLESFITDSIIEFQLHQSREDSVDDYIAQLMK